MFVKMRMIKRSFFLLLSIFIIITGINFSVNATDASEAETITKTFVASENSVEKNRILFSLKEYLPQKPQWVRQLLVTALNDKSPVVVAEAVYQIGAFGFSDCNAELIKLYRVAEKRFRSPGYTERVHCAIIPVLGKTGNSEARTFIASLLRIDNGSYKGGFLLAAVEELNDPVFIKDLRSYKARIERQVRQAKASGVDPFLYSDKTSYIKLATEIELSLLKGGNNE